LKLLRQGEEKARYLFYRRKNRRTDDGSNDIHVFAHFYVHLVLHFSYFIHSGRQNRQRERKAVWLAVLEVSSGFVKKCFFDESPSGPSLKCLPPSSHTLLCVYTKEKSRLRRCTLTCVTIQVNSTPSLAAVVLFPNKLHINNTVRGRESIGSEDVN
jgi:hypothetical protein